MNDISKSVFRTVQQYSDLNIQLAQTILEEGTSAGQHIITAQRPTEAFAAAASHAQPAAEKLRAYQQHLSRIAADTQVDLSNVAEEHVAETSRTAKALADEVQRVASEETEKTMRHQQDAVRQFTDPFAHQNAGGQRQSRGNEMRGSSTMQSANGTDGREGGSMQGGSHQGATGSQSGQTAGAAGQAAASSKQGTARKEP